MTAIRDAAEWVAAIVIVTVLIPVLVVMLPVAIAYAVYRASLIDEPMEGEL